jgi:energy-coupling factor transporter transmembrane protein EcfT
MAFLNDITLGHYWPGDSIVHNLDPRSKLLGLLGVMTTLLMVLNPIMLMAYALFPCSWCAWLNCLRHWSSAMSVRFSGFF